MLSATTSTLFIAATKVLSVGRHHKRNGAAFSRTTSFVDLLQRILVKIEMAKFVLDKYVKMTVACMTLYTRIRTVYEPHMSRI